MDGRRVSFLVRSILGRLFSSAAANYSVCLTTSTGRLGGARNVLRVLEKEKERKYKSSLF